MEANARVELAEASREVLERKARRGVVVLIARAVVLQLTVLGGNVYLARLLNPADFGVFAIAQFALAIFAFLGDAGLAAGLIQKSREPSHAELSTVWWAQIAIASAVVALVFAAAPFVLDIWPDLPRGSDWLLRALSIGLLFTALRVVPALMLERELKFAHLSVLDFVTTLTFYGSAVTLALLGHGVMALVGAVLLQGFVGVVLIHAMRPWRPSLVFDREALKPILKFGLAFQGKSIAGFVNGAVTPIYAGAVLGKYALGLNNFAQNTAYFPLKLVEILGRVTFPLYSRMQEDRQAFAASLARSIRICAIVTLFFVALFFGMGRSVIAVIYTEKWLPALPLLYVYAAAISIGFLSPLIASALDAIGRPQIIFRLAVGWTILNWVVVSLVMLKWRTVMAFAIAYSVHVVVGNLAVILALRRLLPDARIWPSVRSALLAAGVLVALGRWVLDAWVTGPATLLASVVVGLLAFLSVLFVADRGALRDVVSLALKKKLT